MKRFRFRLEPVLTVRNWEEERAKTAYGQALQQHDGHGLLPTQLLGPA